MEEIRRRINDEPQSSCLIEADRQKELDHILSNWDIENKDYLISSHRPISGRILVRGRGLVHGEVKRYVDPIVEGQSLFNKSTSRILLEDGRRFDKINEKLDNIIERSDKIEHWLRETNANIDQFYHSINQQIEDKVWDAIAYLSSDIENKAWLAAILDRRISKKFGNMSPSEMEFPVQGINYFLFEERFRGTRSDIRKRQSIFMSFFENCSNVLDIGCGRGEFLELLKAAGIGARGIDLDDDMVRYCASQGLDAELADAISYLEKIEDESLDGIFIDQVVEHLAPDYIIRLLALCHKKLNYNSNIIIETVNPLSLVSLINFYIDMTHKSPLHPETLIYLLEASGFREIESHFFVPVPEEMRLRKLDLSIISESEKGFAEIYNNNIDILNKILFGSQDYAIIAKKAALNVNSSPA
ncbi:MAG: class I SAM-dependent methyltransferase [Methanotrichaceae archaeon]|nr:class I SAM-dependent methyltransferase [Methanotrichaceae archaeon]